MTNAIEIIEKKIMNLKNDHSYGGYSGMMEAMIDEKVHEAKIDVLEEILYELKQSFVK